MSEPVTATADEIQPKDADGEPRTRTPRDVEDPERRRQRYAAWGITWLSYASYYFGRKGLSVAKAPIAEALGKSALRGVDTSYLAGYALGQYVNGFLGDRVGARKLITVGMLLSAAACFAFGAASTGTIFVVAFAVNGFAQSTGWPGNVKAMAEWTTPKNRGAVMGLWATCYQVGGIAATGLAAWLISRLSWRWAFFGPGAAMALVGVAVWFVLKPGHHSDRKPSENPAHEAEANAEERAARRLAQKKVLTSKLVWSYGASYFFIKLIRYSLLFWLPFYLKTVLKYSTDDAGYLSTSFEIGGIVGTIGMGAISDRFRSIPRSLFAAGSLVLLAFALYGYSVVATEGKLVNFIAMALVGALLYGPDSILSGAAAQDAGGPLAASITAGFINGIGSIGAVLQEVVTVGISEKYGWSVLFDAFLVFALCAALALTPTFRTANKGSDR